MDAANDLALLKAAGRFAALPVAASRAVKLGGTVATVGFPEQDLIRKPGRQEKEFIHGFLDSLFDLNLTRGIYRSVWSLRTATMQPGNHRPQVNGTMPLIRGA